MTDSDRDADGDLLENNVTNDPATGETARGYARAADDAAGDKTKTDKTDGAFDEVPGDDPLDDVPDPITDPDDASDLNAWGWARYAENAADEAKDAATSAAAEEAETNAKNAAAYAKAYRELAEDKADEAEKKADEAEEEAATAMAQTQVATAIAATVTEADAVAKEAASAAAPEDAILELDADTARRDADDAAASAEKYADMPGDDDTMAGDDDDDDDMPMMGKAMVTANGVGNLLKFGSWTTEGMDTLVAVTNLGKTDEKVEVAIMDGLGMRAGTIPVCLNPGDTWTASIGASEDGMGSTVKGGNPGGCSGAMPDTVLTTATYGFIEVYPMDMEGYLMGIATLVNAEMGYASSYNATSLMADLDSDTKGMDIMYALANEGGIRKDMLLGRWGSQCNDRRDDEHRADLPCSW